MYEEQNSQIFVGMPDMYSYNHQCGFTGSILYKLNIYYYET